MFWIGFLWNSSLSVCCHWFFWGLQWIFSHFFNLLFFNCELQKKSCFHLIDHKIDSTIGTLGPDRSPVTQIANVLPPFFFFLLHRCTKETANVELLWHAPESQYTLWPLDVITGTQVSSFQSLPLEFSLVAPSMLQKMLAHTLREQNSRGAGSSSGELAFCSKQSAWNWFRLSGQFSLTGNLFFFNVAASFFVLYLKCSHLLLASLLSDGYQMNGALCLICTGPLQLNQNRNEFNDFDQTDAM